MHFGFAKRRSADRPTLNTRCPLPQCAITLIEPGGAGKSTVGAVLAERLGVRFIDLDRCFAERHGDISAYLRQFGYEATRVQT